MAEIFGFSTERLNAAAERWEKTRRERQRAAKAKREGRYDEVDRTERIVKHANRLQEQVRSTFSSEVATGDYVPPGVRELATSAKVTEADISSLFVERVIGPTKDFLSAEFFEQGLLAMRSVARIDIRVDGTGGFATGFMVSPSLMLTNWHVFEEARWTFASTAQFDFQRDQFGRPKQSQNFEFDGELFINDERLDFALVAVKPRNLTGSASLDSFGYCPLVGIEGKILVTDPVNIVQHPAGRRKEVVIRKNELSALPEGELDGFAHYVADTEQGSSGSPVLNDRWEVIALHHSGVPERDKDGNYLRKDGGIWDPSMDLDLISWIGNEGIRISRIISHLRALRDGIASRKMQQLVDELLSNANTDEIGPRSNREATPPDPAVAQGQAAIALGMVSGTATVTVPVTITVRVGGGQAISANLDVLGAVEAVRPADFNVPRPGYDPNFLCAPVPMPDLVDGSRGKLATLADGSTELRYFHYSVMMNADRRLAYVSAVNYDAAAPFVESRGNDSWFPDPRLDLALQADNRHYKDYDGKKNPLDRGHLTRRYDAGWGYSEQEAKRANDDTFHWPNCSPQHEVFNQSKLSQPKDLRLWGELENHITEQAKAGTPKLSIFNGPVFGESDREYRGLRIPSAFWKIVCYCNEKDKPSALGFVLYQTDLVDRLRERFTEAFDPGRFDVRQVKISRIEEMTGLDFKQLRNIDPMVERGVFETSAAPDRKLTSVSDIKF